MVFLSIVLSLICLSLLAGQDGPRYSAFRQKPVLPPMGRGLLWAAALAPGVGLAVFGSAAGVTLWFGAVCATGWLWVAQSPKVHDEFLGGVRGMFRSSRPDPDSR